MSKGINLALERFQSPDTKHLMPIIQNKYLEGALGAVVALIHGSVIPGEFHEDGRVPKRRDPPKLEGMAKVRLARLRRELEPKQQDVANERIAVAKKHCHVDDDGNPKAVKVTKGWKKKGEFDFLSEESREACIQETEAILKDEVEIKQTIALSDFRRRERDPDGRVFETDEVDGWIIESLLNCGLLVVEEAEAAEVA